MTLLYKLTDAEGWTRRGYTNALHWQPGVTHTATGEGSALCTDGVIHAYASPLLAVMMNPIHAAYEPARLWRCEGEAVADDGTKVGAKALTCLDEMPLPAVTTGQCVAFGILAARRVCADPEWIAWADAWLDGTDRSIQASEEGALSWDCLDEMPLPAVTTGQCVAFGILATRRVCADPEWLIWADAWLDGTDRSADAAARAAAAATLAVSWAAASAAAAIAATRASEEGARSWAEARAAAWVAARVAEAGTDLVAIAEEAMR